MRGCSSLPPEAKGISLPELLWWFVALCPIKRGTAWAQVSAPQPSRKSGVQNQLEQELAVLQPTHHIPGAVIDSSEDAGLDFTGSLPENSAVSDSFQTWEQPPLEDISEARAVLFSGWTMAVPEPWPLKITPSVSDGCGTGLGFQKEGSRDRHLQDWLGHTVWWQADLWLLGRADVEHINCLEMMGRGHHVLVRSDNVTVVAYIKSPGGLRSRLPNRLARHLSAQQELCRAPWTSDITTSRAM